MSNSRFPVSLHILTLLNAAKGDLVSSEYLAGSININPVLVRKEIMNLRKHGFVESKEGKGGGSFLAKSAKDINLGEVYKSVRSSNVLGQSKNEPNPKCPIGRQINQHLDALYLNAENALIENLSKQTLADFASGFE
ncbi:MULTISPECIES: Rrf2 family transcriptional regulator [Pedobacter]|uniref:HTH-type transcriptional regulator YwnA n=1 Tax=Pedobacter zeae TaxID=1737356 RepID=A0A7W6K6N9_9SPHI|nr:Rrf2 family transcriptional regulator [Pedobacter zeae]MBB4106181.1 Rrf2 family protein [Pedobacter zeae]GGH00006.1 putative HTH-type transcriptional regulator YwnA [Pedobacter zeae]